jgi:hypothetical protein
MKKPGQMAHDAHYEGYGFGHGRNWKMADQEERAVWARVESAIRADEAAKVRAATIEEAEELLFGMMRRDKLHGPEWMEAMLAARGAIRALEEKK